MPHIRIPLARSADRILEDLARSTGSAAIARLDGMTLLGERAMLSDFRIPGRISAGGGCRLYDAADGTIALNLAREADRELLPALFETDELGSAGYDVIARSIAAVPAARLLERGRLLGLAIAAEQQSIPSPEPVRLMTRGNPLSGPKRTAPRVIDLSALWAGPLAAHVLWLAGAEVVKVESRSRPDAMREGDAPFYRLLNQGKASAVLDLVEAQDRRALIALLEASDVVIEAARPRGLAQLGVDADAIVRATPGLVWITITGHGADGEAAGWVGFGDDCGVAAGLSAALRNATGQSGFVGDAIADPLAGLHAALVAWSAWASGQGGRYSVAMSHVAAASLQSEREAAPSVVAQEMRSWIACRGKPFPEVSRREIGTVPALGSDTRAILAMTA